MKEKSGVDMLKDILKEMKQMRKEMRVLDQNIKRIANSAKISEIATMAINTPLKDWGKPSVSAVAAPNSQIESIDPSTIKQSNLRFKFETVDASRIKQEAPNRAARTTKPTACRCHGKMIAESKGKSLPLPSLSVKIYDDKDTLVKETKTNKAGEWVSFLPKGNYVANIEGKFNGNDLYPVNLGFAIKADMKDLEVK